MSSLTKAPVEHVTMWQRNSDFMLLLPTWTIWIFIWSLWPARAACRLVLVYDWWFFLMLVLLTFEACTCFCHFWNVSVCLLTWAYSMVCSGRRKYEQDNMLNPSLCQVKVDLYLRRCFLNAFYSQHRPAFFPHSPPFCSDLGRLIGRSLLSPRKTGGCDCQSVLTWCEAFCLHVVSIWNAAFANMQSGLGGMHIFLVMPLFKNTTTPAQLFRIIPQ